MVDGSSSGEMHQPSKEVAQAAAAAQRAKFAEKVHKPPLWVNVINFELNGLDASIWVPWSPSKSHDALIFKFIRNKLHFCTYIESETLKIYFEVCEPFR